VCLVVPSFWDIFNLTSVKVLFMVDEIALEQVFIRVLRLFLVHGIPSMLHNHSFIYHRCYIILATAAQLNYTYTQNILSFLQEELCTS